jgi:SAM-dependent methyltransferase
MRQADIFLESEGDAYFQRNRSKPDAPDHVAAMIETAGIKPERVLEVGCGNGRRLAALRDKYGCEIFGVEPSLQACLEAAQLRVPAFHSSAVVLPVTGLFDLVIYGFCLYLTDPADWLRIAAEGDCVLAPGGHIIIHDFAGSVPFARKYEHRDGVLSYHFYFPKLWLAHPMYEIASRQTFGDEAVTILRKTAKPFEVRP